MRKRELSFLHDITDEDRILLNKFLDWSEMAQEKYVRKFSFFLDERQQVLCTKVMASVKFEDYQLWGGREGAERKVLCVYPEYGRPEREDIPIKAVTFTYRREDRLSHRDILGSLMGLKIDRSCVGDILVGEGKSCIFVVDTVLADVLSVTRVGRTGVKSSEGFDPDLAVTESFKEITGTVASLRFDSILSLGLRISREKAAALIKSGSAEVGHMKADQPKRLLQEGDVFSVRGYGKFIFRSVNGKTGKDRIHITISKYI
ncbi:MAG: RNA-binding protein [Ruminococcus sp.]|nr:RNA-binding protein [Ruminococcus sp.]